MTPHLCGDILFTDGRRYLPDPKGSDVMHNSKKIKNVGWVFLVLGLAYLINPFDVPGPIDDALAMSAATIIKIICDVVSANAAKQLSRKEFVYEAPEYEEMYNE